MRLRLHSEKGVVQASGMQVLFKLGYQLPLGAYFIHTAFFLCESVALTVLTYNKSRGVRHPYR